MISELLQTSALRQALVQYLGREWSTSELEEWLVGNLQDILSSGDRKAIDLANHIDALFVEKSEGLLSEEKFRETVKSLVYEDSLGMSLDASGSTNTVISSETIVAPIVLVRVRHSFARVEADR
jgi:hypothetical protein